MKVFITWSGERSLVVAEMLREWLPSVIQKVEPFLSPKDIRSGARWAQVIAQELKTSRFGIVCLTQENKSAHPWVQFEAGGIASQLDESHVAVLLIDLTVGDLDKTNPLTQFQATAARDKARVVKLVEDINQLAGDLPPWFRHDLE